jgi:hypothetical protein
MRRKEKKFWLTLIDEDEKKIRKIEKAKDRKDTRFFERDLERFNKPIKNEWL